jgi:predicted DNA-binding transcriptional regulator YafY
MIVELLRQKSIRFSEYERQYERDYRSFQRDLQQLRAIGVAAGFTISNIVEKELVKLLSTDDKVKNLNRGAERAERLMATIAKLSANRSPGSWDLPARRKLPTTTSTCSRRRN